jgi:hypothetical protein
MSSRNDKLNTNASPNQNSGLFYKIFGRKQKPTKNPPQNEHAHQTINQSISHSQSTPKIFNQNETYINSSNINSNNNNNNNHKRSHHNVFSFGNDSNVKKDYESLANERDFNSSSAFKQKKIPSMSDISPHFTNNENNQINAFNSHVVKNTQHAPNTQQSCSQIKVIPCENDPTKNGNLNYNTPNSNFSKYFFKLKRSKDPVYF